PGEEKKSLVISDGVEDISRKTVLNGHVFNPNEICGELAAAMVCSTPNRVEFDGSPEFTNDQVKSFLHELGIENSNVDAERLVVVPEYKIKPVIVMPKFGY
ncbi:MAG: hypothetical protein GTO45_11395, partial [Candidatus Aminicenantes bacterium]|nr:hypothetical protein [Candidatus Aminicenantes bacterium]NIM79410.1 hypothetical protein [Candidatus Aminicenantes bacterium]NIN18692.1 hypothetical protein [Candidatus Aminicenantes bacterium]NIN42616.1 hypothetical protein [Candidatus Aminicenantes bacterium]NIN85355.1 hypothetical protein [Candidatus Aminicenantes bacterium]